MNFFDTHCHLDFSVFDPIRSQVLDSCECNGVSRILLPGVSASHWERLLKLAESDDRFLVALGLHPCFLAEHKVEHIELLTCFIKDFSVAAVGEIGLDFWAGTETKSLQLELLDAQLELAREAMLPVILHSRKSHDVLISRLRRVGVEQGVVHAFSGSWQQAVAFLDQGLKLGLGGTLTYPRANKLREIVKRLPLDAMVLETDAPDMPLNGRQGSLNRPDYLPEVFAVLCELRDEDPAVLAQCLWDNSVQLFARAS